MNMKTICDERIVCIIKEREKMILAQYLPQQMQQIKHKSKLRTYYEIKDAFILKNVLN